MEQLFHVLGGFKNLFHISSDTKEAVVKMLSIGRDFLIAGNCRSNDGTANITRIQRGAAMCSTNYSI